jgi:hypothetical protein
MQSSNPVLGRAFNQRGYAAFDPTTTSASPATLETLYNAPAASSLRTGRSDRRRCMDHEFRCWRIDVRCIRWFCTCDGEHL